MTAFVALLRAVNVGGTGKLPMRDLVSLCEAAGFGSVQTYIASGNVVFSSDAREDGIVAKLEEALHDYAGKPVRVFVRTAGEIAEILASNPFPDAPPNKVAVVFLDARPSPAVAETLSGQTNETVRTGVREIYVHYPDGMGRSKLKIPGAEDGTARNMNTVAKLAGMARKL